MSTINPQPPTIMFTAIVIDAVQNWDGKHNIDLYRLIADALGMTLWEMANEIRRELNDSCDPRDTDSAISQWRQRIKDRTRLAPEPPAQTDISPMCAE